jgi:hypothetical protein
MSAAPITTVTHRIQLHDAEVILRLYVLIDIEVGSGLSVPSCRTFRFSRHFFVNGTAPT